MILPRSLLVLFDQYTVNSTSILFCLLTFTNCTNIYSTCKMCVSHVQGPARCSTIVLPAQEPALCSTRVSPSQEPAPLQHQSLTCPGARPQQHTSLDALHELCSPHAEVKNVVMLLLFVNNDNQHEK